MDQFGAGRRHFLVEIGDGRELMAQGGDLADHVHALSALGLLVDLHQAVVTMGKAFACHPQAAQVQDFDSPTFLGGHLVGFEPGFGVGECPYVVGLDAAGGMPG